MTHEHTFIYNNNRFIRYSSRARNTQAHIRLYIYHNSKIRYNRLDKPGERASANSIYGGIIGDAFNLFFGGIRAALPPTSGPATAPASTPPSLADVTHPPAPVPVSIDDVSRPAGAGYAAMTETDTVATHLPEGATVQTEGDYRENMKAIREINRREERELRDMLKDELDDYDGDDLIDDEIYLPTYDEVSEKDMLRGIRSPPPGYRSNLTTPALPDEDGPDTPGFKSAASSVASTPMGSPNRPVDTSQASIYGTPQQEAVTPRSQPQEEAATPRPQPEQEAATPQPDPLQLPRNMNDIDMPIGAIPDDINPAYMPASRDDFIMGVKTLAGLSVEQLKKYSRSTSKNGIEIYNDALAKMSRNASVILGVEADDLYALALTQES